MSEFMLEAIEFRMAMGQPVNTIDRSIITLQLDLIGEEFWELDAALSALWAKYPRALMSHSHSGCIEKTISDLEVNALKETADLVYVCYQLAAAVGWDLDEALERVHKSNMSKLVDDKPVKDPVTGKVLKGPNYQPPDLRDCV